tara:strand:+ start:8045 stop:8650 length:606 start_codon:yes stop_codon:yes gene_type:complete
MQNTIFLKARYLNAELKECEEVFLKYHDHFFKEVRVLTGDGPNQERSIDSDNAGILKHQLDNSNDGEAAHDPSDDLENSFLNKKLKTLYRKVVQVCHPDKHSSYLSQSDKNNLTKIYSDCTGAVRDGNLYYFLECASKLYMEIPELSDEEISILKKNCLKIEDDIKKIKNTYPWIWGVQSDEDQRKNILNHFLASKGYQTN